MWKEGQSKCLEMGMVGQTGQPVWNDMFMVGAERGGREEGGKGERDVSIPKS